jgi:hypothetical protein
MQANPTQTQELRGLFGEAVQSQDAADLPINARTGHVAVRADRS